MTQNIKCVVWDLDGTLWDGTLLEGDSLRLRPDIPVILEELGKRGILNSIASRNENNSAWGVLEEFEIDQYFLAPQINFNPKADNIRTIAKELNIGIDSLIFIDDNAFEREGVASAHPEVTLLDASDYKDILSILDFKSEVQTEESRQRAEFYKRDEQRKQVEKEFIGSHLDFLKGCNIELDLRLGRSVDINRIVELSVRTNQFNSTGVNLTTGQVSSMIDSSDTILILAELRDKFGSYGNIGTLILKLEENMALVENLMISCRAAGRGVSAAMMILALKISKNKDMNLLLTDYRENDRNRQLGIFYTMMGFSSPTPDQTSRGNCLVYDFNEYGIPENPEWIRVNLLDNFGITS